MAKTIPVLWLSLLALTAISSPPPSGLAPLVRADRETPSAARRAAVEQWAASHPQDAPLARLALGIAAYEQKDFAGSIAQLKKLRGQLPQVGDYIAYYLGAARVEARDFDGVAADLKPAHAAATVSPFSGRAWILEARAAKDRAPAEAVRVLREHYAELPQPEGDINLADSFLASGDQAHAAESYQRVYYQFVSGDAAARAAAAIASLQQSMGTAYPAAPPQLMLRRADRLLDARLYPQARAEYRSLAGELSGPERDLARVGVGAADFMDGATTQAYPYLRGLELPDTEADAERLYYLAECAWRLTGDDELHAALDRLERHYPRSPWRLKALLSAANRYLLVNQPADFVPFYRAVYQGFPEAAEAPQSHWKVAFQAYLHDQTDAGRLLREHLRNYPAHYTAGSALYFLGRRFELDRDVASARACYQWLVRTWDNHYYAMLSRERLAATRDLALGTPSMEIAQFLANVIVPAAQPVPRQPTAETNLRIERSRILRNAGLADLADSELRFGARHGGQSPLLGMEMAGAADAPHQGMRIMKGMAPEYLNLPIDAAPRQFWELLFPLPYRAELDKAARDQDLDLYLLAGLIRQESEFDPKALSHANAYGLTQVRPATGRQYARKLGIPRFTKSMLFQPAANVEIGSSIFRGMLTQNNGRVEQTLAAYNAGPGRLTRWLGWNEYREPAEFVESIPFTETRDYVQAVLRNADLYRRLYGR
ncbi:MAG: lytic transglycosylase domain-containing protein [Bryobacteraceae bacterium]